MPSDRVATALFPWRKLQVLARYCSGAAEDHVLRADEDVYPNLMHRSGA